MGIKIVFWCFDFLINLGVVMKGVVFVERGVIGAYDNISGSSSVGRVFASQAKSREFESRLPLRKDQLLKPVLVNQNGFFVFPEKQYKKPGKLSFPRNIIM